MRKDDLSSHPLDGNLLALPELRNALELLEGVAVAFKIPDVLLEKPSGMHITEIGQKAGVNHQKLGRILRLLVSKHIFREVAVDRFRVANNRLSLELLFKSSFQHGRFTPKGAKYGTMFGVGIGGWNNAVQTSASLAGTTVCDLGGGIGNVAMQLVKAHPNLQLKPQDLPAVIQEAETKFWPHNCPAAIAEKRIDFKAVDFLVESPIQGCDIYYNANRTEDAAFQQAPEPMLPNFGVGRIRQYSLDIFMMTLFNSMERTLKEFTELAQKAGLEFVTLWPTGETGIIESRPCDQVGDLV
ncbi:hypothetical protein H0H92_010368 [Tricholoma furcatifolium]|nr:hypothetical protein H0H92_010368 [Tricholoma furcatifolium]